MVKLKKCPFCGGDVEVRQYTSTLSFAQCTNCKATSNAFETEEEAAGAWNERCGLLRQYGRR